MSGLAVFAVEVGPVAVLVPPGSFVRQGTVSDSNVVVSVFCREGAALVVAQRVTCDQRKGKRRALNIISGRKEMERRTRNREQHSSGTSLWHRSVIMNAAG